VVKYETVEEFQLFDKKTRNVTHHIKIRLYHSMVMYFSFLYGLY
jgi:hypothetical protein